ncbi:MAG: ctaD [Solirubrobacterales bacterium]|nr:ctaD [Solirubrobacterales bacterium]
MTPPTASQVRPEVVTRGVHAPAKPWVERATSADHKAVGLLYIATSLSFLSLAAVEFALLRLQLIVPENSLIQPEIFNRLLSTAPVTLVVLAAIPLALGLIGYIVPLQIGARSVAFPRLNQLSYWLYLVGGVTIYASFLYTAPETGTISLPPLSDAVFAPTNGTDSWIAGTALATLGFVCFAINLVVTLNRLRAPGVAWRRMPLFAWAATVIGWLLVVIGPVMIAALTMLEIDRHFDGVFFDPGEGGAPLLYEHLAYIYFTGAYLIVFLAAAGAISEILPTFARKPVFSHRAVAASFVAIGILGPLAWMQNMYEAPLNEGWTIMAMAFALALVVPVGVLLYVWIATIWGGTLDLRAATWYALGAISIMACGLAGELSYSVVPVGWLLDDTTASQGSTLYVLVGGAVIGGFAALHYWFPKVCGRLLGEGLGKAALALMFIGINLYVLMMFMAGLEGQPVDVFQYFEGTGVDGYNLVASLAAFLLVGGILLELGNAAYSWNNGLRARGHDPWRGATLEWFALSPPPPHNFDAVPDVRSTEPMHDIRESIRRRTEAFVAPAALERPPSPAPRPAEPVPATAETSASETTDPDAADGGGSSVA